MITLPAALLASIAATANIAPSVHNTQPTRWRFVDGALWLLADRSRRLSVGDPQGRDLRLSVGTAVEGTALALAAAGYAISNIDLLPASSGDLEPLVRFELAPIQPTRLPPEINQRMTWRRGFARASLSHTQALEKWAESQPDLTLLGSPAAIRHISELNERASLDVFRNKSYRAELLSWMRLSRSDPRFGVDGLSAPALGLSGIEALGAGIVLRSPMFGILDQLGLAAGLFSERTRTQSSSAVLIFHRPVEEDPVDTGRHLYLRLLGLTALGFFTWPMAVLADDPSSAAEISVRYGVPNDRRIITVWRAGTLPAGAAVQRERLPASALVI